MNLSDNLMVEGTGYKASYKLHPTIATCACASAGHLQRKARGLGTISSSSTWFMKLMRSASTLCLLATVLRNAQFSYNDTKYMVAAYQRQNLETLAMYDYVNKFTREIPEVDDDPIAFMILSNQYEKDLMGCFTGDLIVVQRLFEWGVPVWYIWPTVSIPRDIALMLALRRRE